MTSRSNAAAPRRAAHRPWRWRLILPVCSVIFALLLAEALFRVAVQLKLIAYPQFDQTKIVHKYADNPQLVYDLKPSFSEDWHGILIKTNALGMRDHEYPLQHPPGVVRIAIIGDSVVFGGDMPLEQTFPKLLEAQLNRQAGERYEVMSFADVGYNSAQEEIVLKEKVLKTAPDVVLLGFCLNDDTYTDGLAELTRELHPAALGSRLHSKLLSYLLFRRERRNFASGTDFSQVAHLFAALGALGRRQGFRPLILIFPYRYHDIESYPFKGKHAAVRAAAEKNGVAWIDFMDVFSSLSADERQQLFTPDGVHFTPLGMQRVAAYLFEQRARYLPQ